MIRRTSPPVLAVALLFSIVSHVPAAERAAPFVVTGGVRQLFLDDAGIEKRQGLHRTLHPPRRHPANPVVRPDKPWEHYCSLYGTVVFDPKRDCFRMWYLTSPRDRGLRMLELGGSRVRAPHTTLAAYAESHDGVSWVKPKLGQLPYDGDSNNNLLDLGINNCEGMSVLVDVDDPDPARRYKCLYWDHGSGGYEVRDGKPYCKPGEDDGMCAAVSADGITWKPLAENPIIKRYCDTNQNLLFDPALGRYVAFSRFGMGRVLARSESADFRHWTEPALVLKCDDADGPAAQIYGAGVERYEGVYLAMIWIYHEGTDATIDTQLATSRDGIHWTRVADRAVWLALRDSDSWQGGMVRSVERIIRRGDELLIYYGGIHGPHGRPGHPTVERKHRGALGLAIQRRDGFVSLDAGQDEGWLLTRPFRLPAGALHVNVDAREGELRAQLCDAAGEPLEDFEVSQPVTGDQLDAVVRFGTGNLSAYAHQTVRLRITARQARLYSYWFAAAGDR